MERLRWENFNGKDIFVMDLSNMDDPDKIMKVIEKARMICANQEEGSRLSITYVQGVAYNKAIITAFKRLAKETKRSSKKAAVVGANGFRKIILMLIQSLTGRSFVKFGTIQDAKRALSKY